RFVHAVIERLGERDGLEFEQPLDLFLERKRLEFLLELVLRSLLFCVCHFSNSPAITISNKHFYAGRPRNVPRSVHRRPYANTRLSSRRRRLVHVALHALALRTNSPQPQAVMGRFETKVVR